MKASIKRWRTVTIVPVTVLPILVGCGPREPATDAERLARGREIVERMSAKLGAAQSFTVTTDEKRDQIRAGGDPAQTNVTRELVVRRPDRLYIRTQGDHENEAYYDGVGLTLVMHKHKVFGQARMPETLDRALDAISERYGVPMPVGDFLYSSPAKALLSDKSSGGWVRREDVGGRPQDHVAFTDSGVKWDLWVAATGDPLPSRAVVELPNNKRLKKLDVTFRDWNLAANIPADRFDPTVPKDYEGIAIVQRASVLRNIPDAAGAPEGGAPKR
jgi:hypothetical protein